MNKQKAVPKWNKTHVLLFIFILKTIQVYKLTLFTKFYKKCSSYLPILTKYS